MVRRLREAALAHEDGAKLAEAVAALEGGMPRRAEVGPAKTRAQRAGRA
ncbi:MAG: hypothetical protein U5L11_12650 [Arhodomonas sp.]|nr:hypothetical protein [Arhodomonas sp.]